MLSNDESKSESDLQGKITSLEKENHELRHEIARLRLGSQESEKKSQQIQTPTVNDSQENTVEKKKTCGENKEILTRVPRLPPLPGSATSSVNVDERKIQSGPVPPPPPLPSKSITGLRAVRRVPEVMEFYRSLARRDTRLDNKTNSTTNQSARFSKNMIGEIENRSTYLSAIKSDVETQGEFINMIATEVTNAAHKDISDVEAFVKWLDEELSYLVDERAVLKHFKQWPERKADALREAAFSYRDLKNLEFEASSFQDNPKEPLIQALKRMQTLQDRLEQSVNNIERVRESMSKKYKEFHIPWEWMLETGVIGQMKLGSIRLAREYMKRISKELTTNKESEFTLQGVRFAYRVHQFAGGFDLHTKQTFEELRKVVTNYRK